MAGGPGHPVERASIASNTPLACRQAPPQSRPSGLDADGRPAAPPPAAAAGYAPLAYYTSPVSRQTYIFSNGLLTQAGALSHCALVGGSLAAYESLAEQADVEGYYVAAGYLLPRFHQCAAAPPPAPRP